MAEVADLPGCEGAFVGIQLEFCVSEALEDLTEAFEMFLPHSGEDNDDVPIKEARFPVEAGEDAIHETREGGGCVAEAKRDLVELK